MKRIRHLYALYCLLQRDLSDGKLDVLPDDPPPSPSWPPRTLPSIFTDPGWSLLSTSILSTSNCGNPALRLFGFGPVAADGYGIGYIIKDDGISMCLSHSLWLKPSLILHYLDVHHRSIFRRDDSSTRLKCISAMFNALLSAYIALQMRNRRHSLITRVPSVMLVQDAPSMGT